MLTLVLLINLVFVLFSLLFNIIRSPEIILGRENLFSSWFLLWVSLRFIYRITKWFMMWTWKKTFFSPQNQKSWYKVEERVCLFDNKKKIKYLMIWFFLFNFSGFSVDPWQQSQPSNMAMIKDLQVQCEKDMMRVRILFDR